MNDNILEPNINGYPAVTDWEKVIVVLQQANELLLRGASIKDLSNWIVGDIEIQGADFYDLPVSSGTDPVALPIPTVAKKFGFLANGKFTQPTGSSLEYSATQWGLALFDGTKWVKRFTLDLPVKPTNGVVVKNDPNPVSGGTTFETINQFALESINLANYLDFKGEIWAKQPTTNKVVSSSAANWISIRIQNLETTKVHNLQGIGTISASNAIIIYSDINNTYISEVLMSDFNGDFTPPTGTINTYIRLANKSEIGLPEHVHSNEFVNSIMISKGSGKKPFQKYGQFSIKQSSVVEDFPKMFVQLFPYTAPYAGVKISHEVAHIYENINKNVYARHILLYEKLDYADYISGDFLGGEVVRYAGCKLFSYDVATGIFTDMAKTMIIIPESEFVMSSGGWIGGYHGYENLSAVNFIINNKTYNTNGNLNFTATGLISCNSFSYSMVSVMKLPDKTNYADRIKISDFINGGYSVRSRFKMLKTDTFMAYMGIVCVSKYFTQVSSDTSKTVVPTASNLFPIDNDTMSRELMYSSADYMVTVSNKVSESLLDNKCLIRLWDRSSDTKYYRQLPSYTPALGEYFETTTVVKLKSL